MSKWIAEFELEDGDTMPEHMDLNYMGAHIDFHCRPMWIPVSERLPEKSGFYLVSIGDLVATYPFDGHNFRLRDNTCIIYVDAWMPLPKPYKAESEDKK